MIQKKWIIGIASVVVLLVVTIWAISPSDNKQITKVEPKGKLAATEGDGNVEAGHVLGSGATPRAGEQSKTKLPLKDKGNSYGTLPPIKADANPQVKAVAEALRDKKHPEMYSTAIQPKPFDAKAYAADPEAYLNTVEPGRVFQVAQPGKDVPRLTAVSSRYQEITQGQTVILQVQAPFGMPVSYTSFDCGQFSNKLGAITVKANREGIAQAAFTATPGTLEDIHILAACPQASGQVRFVVNVRMPAKSVATTAKP